MWNRRGVFSFVWLFLLVISIIPGCGGNGEARYVPSEDTAQEALSVALKAWQDGQAHGTITSWKVPIDTYDARWQTGAKLEKFEVLRAEQLDHPRAFIVKMKVSSDKQEQEVTYIVYGNDPLIIFRKQDYDKTIGVGGG